LVIVSKSRFRFEPMRREDVPAVVEVERRCFAAPWTAGQFKHELKIPFSRTIIAWSEAAAGRIAGYICRWVVGDEVSILNIAVDPDFQRQGLGREMVEIIVDEAHALGASSIALEVREKNAAARVLYTSLGFTEAGIRRNYYGKDDHAIVMCRSLGGASPDALCPISG
jgi:ribosomal-protein-alanine N-acetyltransferase